MYLQFSKEFDQKGQKHIVVISWYALSLQQSIGLDGQLQGNFRASGWGVLLASCQKSEVTTTNYHLGTNFRPLGPDRSGYKKLLRKRVFFLTWAEVFISQKKSMSTMFWYRKFDVQIPRSSSNSHLNTLWLVRWVPTWRFSMLQKCCLDLTTSRG